jgi:hypothetical protein
MALNTLQSKENMTLFPDFGTTFASLTGQTPAKAFLKIIT